AGDRLAIVTPTSGGVAPPPPPPLPPDGGEGGGEAAPKVNAHAAPSPSGSMSQGAPMSAVEASAERDTDHPNSAFPAPSAGSATLCDAVQLAPERSRSQAAPAVALSLGPPTSAVVPSPERAIAEPKFPLPISSAGPVSFCVSVQVEPERVKAQTAP